MVMETNLFSEELGDSQIARHRYIDLQISLLVSHDKCFLHEKVKNF